LVKYHSAEKGLEIM